MTRLSFLNILNNLKGHPQEVEIFFHNPSSEGFYGKLYRPSQSDTSSTPCQIIWESAGHVPARAAADSHQCAIYIQKVNKMPSLTAMVGKHHAHGGGGHHKHDENKDKPIHIYLVKNGTINAKEISQIQHSLNSNAATVTTINLANHSTSANA